MTDERIRALERAVKSAPTDAASRLELARELVRVGRREGAREHLAAALRAEPLSPEAVRTLDDLGFGPLAHDAPWPTIDGGNDHARRSAHPGARRGELAKRIRIGREGELARSITVGATAAYVATSLGRLVALDLATGAPRWTLELGVDFLAPAVGEGERLLLCASGAIRLLESERGEELWTRKLPGRLPERPVAVTFAPGGLVLAAAGSTLHAFSVTDGSPLWRFEPEGELDAFAVSGGIFVASSHGSLAVLGADGRVVSSASVPRGRARMHVLTHEVYIQSSPEKRYAEPTRYLVSREGSRLGDAVRLRGPLRTFSCAIDDERFLMAGAEAALVERGGEVVHPLGRMIRAGIADSGGCIYAAYDEGLGWFDSSGALVRNVLPGANDVGPFTVGPGSTLLAASPRGILHVVA